MYEWICAWCFCRFLANYSGPSGVPCPPHSDPRQGHHRPSSLLIFHCPHTKRFSREREREEDECVWMAGRKVEVVREIFRLPGKKGKHLPSVCRDVSDFFLNFISLFVWLPTKKKRQNRIFIFSSLSRICVGKFQAFQCPLITTRCPNRLQVAC